MNLAIVSLLFSCDLNSYSFIFQNKITKDIELRFKKYFYIFMRIVLLDIFKKSTILLQVH